jgi:Zn-dependent peptidase ImmA (M78 family)
MGLVLFIDTRVKKQSLLDENKELKKFIKSLKQKRQKEREKNPVVEAPKVTVDDQDILLMEKMVHNDDFDGTIPEEHFYADYTESDLMRIVKDHDTIIKLLKKHGISKHTANRTLFIFDDLVGSSLFNNKKNNPFKKLNTTTRHLSASILMVSQGYKELPKTVRTNFSALILFEIFSDSELAGIEEEYPMGMHKKQWMQAYEYCVAGDHNFLYYNMQLPKHLRLMKNFDEVVYFQ